VLGVADIGASLVVAAKDSGGSFLVSPGLGLMIWTLLLFGITMWVLSKVAFPRIQEALDKRRRALLQPFAQPRDHHALRVARLGPLALHGGNEPL